MGCEDCQCAECVHVDRHARSGSCLIHRRNGKQTMVLDKEMYAPCVAYEKGGRVLDVELLRALYGTVKVNCLFWQYLEKYLMADWGFILNPYDECVANKTIEGYQCTIVSCVDDKKYHMNKRQW